jgi:ABC-type transport system substrate-binding protein
VIIFSALRVGFTTLLILPQIAFATMQSGRFTTFDRYGLADSPDREDPMTLRYKQFMDHAEKGGTLKMSVLDSIDLIFPSYYMKGQQRQVMPSADNFLFEPLMRANASGQTRTLYPLAAKAVRVDASTSTYVIELRDDVKFWDGTPVRAEDVLAAYKFQAEEVNGPALQNWFDSVWGKVDLRVLSPLEVQVRFPDIAAGKQRNALWNFLNGTPLVKANPQPVPGINIPFPYQGTGPYKVTSADRDHIKLAKRADYWDAQSKYFKMLIRLSPDSVNPS